ncbi:DUF2637 domain-containing protein [Streptomyces filamentosus]|uniref:DUF2637 domain-containing protein n=2 Tax=Streptomyces filamentosus TaxID=67294 RepID=UPI0037D34957
MSETLTDTHTPAVRGAMAPAAPETAGAVPAATPAAPAFRKGAPPAPRKGGPGWPGEGGEGMSTAPAGQAAAPGRVATPPAAAGVSPRVLKWLRICALVAMIPVGVIGFAASYNTLMGLAEAAGFAPWLAPVVPAGIDGAIIGFLALDLYKTARRTPWPLLRFAAHAMTAATVVLNAMEGAVVKTAADLAGHGMPTPARMLWHGLMPVLFVVGVEAVRRQIVHACHLEDGTGTDRIPLHRWILSPVRTPRLYRRMRLAAVRSYTDMVEREQALEGYRVWLTQHLGGDLSKATDEQLLPMTMAPRGYTVEEALALPAQWKAEADQRAAEEAERQAESERQEAERKALAEAEEAERRAARAIREAETAARVKVAEAKAAAAGATAQAEARAAEAAAEAAAEEAAADGQGRAEAARVRAEQVRTQAERQAAIVAEAEESAELAAARARKAESDRIAAQEAARAAAARLEAEQAAAQADRLAAERQRLEAARAADARRAEEEQANAELFAADAAQRRAARAEAEAQAEAAEDYISLSPRQRNARRVARMLLAAQPDTPAEEIPHDAVSLKEIQDRLGVSRTIAGELRQEAVEILQNGYARSRVATEAAYEPAQD